MGCHGQGLQGEVSTIANRSPGLVAGASFFRPELSVMLLNGRMSCVLTFIPPPRYSPFTHFTGKGRGHLSDHLIRPMACDPKEYRAHAESCLRRARTVLNPILAEEFEKLAQSWLRLAGAQERGEVRLQSLRADHPPSDFILSAIDRFLDPRRYPCWTTAWSSFASSLSRRSLC